MLEQTIRDNLESVVSFVIQYHGGDETLAFDIAKQCVSEDDVTKCLDVMLEHVSKEEIAAFIVLAKSDAFTRYTQAINEGMRTIDGKIEDTLKLLNQTDGSC
jgi:hypothetical protein